MIATERVLEKCDVSLSESEYNKLSRDLSGSDISKALGLTSNGKATGMDGFVEHRQAQRSGVNSKNSVKLCEGRTTCLESTVRTEDSRQYRSTYICTRTIEMLDNKMCIYTIRTIETIRSISLQ